MLRLLLISCFLFLSQLGYSQYYVIHESNTEYYYFAEQEKYIINLINRGIVDEKIKISAQADFNGLSPLFLVDKIRSNLSDGFSTKAFQHLNLKNTLSNSPLERRLTFVHKNQDSSIECILQVRLVFEGASVEIEKNNPKIKQIDILFGKEIGVLKDEKFRDAILANKLFEKKMASIPPPPTFPFPEFILDINTEMKTDEISGAFQILLPVECELRSGAIDHRNFFYYYAHISDETNFEIRKLSKLEWKDQQVNDSNVSNFISGVLLGKKREEQTSNELDYTIQEGTFIHRNPENKKAWTKVFFKSNDEFWTLTMRYNEKDRHSSKVIRQKIIESILPN